MGRGEGPEGFLGLLPIPWSRRHWGQNRKLQGSGRQPPKRQAPESLKKIQQCAGEGKDKWGREDSAGQRGKALAGEKSGKIKAREEQKGTGWEEGEKARTQGRPASRPAATCWPHRRPRVQQAAPRVWKPGSRPRPCPQLRHDTQSHRRGLSSLSLHLQNKGIRSHKSSFYPRVSGHTHQRISSTVEAS